jgi:acylphosphatase
MQKQADRLGLAGWVRNLPDGNVEAVIEGAPSAVDEPVAWCADGPPAARVHEVTANLEPLEGLQGFEVLR